jgi:glycosyltransferase involved in cell wall biosynthesis
MSTSQNSANSDQSELELTILMPCLNEYLTLGVCIDNARQFLEKEGVHGEILIADNGSTDGSIELAESKGARVVHQSKKGYGAALKAGIASAKGKYIIMGDCDESYDFLHLSPFVEKLREGYSLVMGNRFRGGISRGAMPPLHRYFGNPFLTLVGRVFFKASKFGDFYCGLRGFSAEKVRSLYLHSDGMEFALEMVVKFSMRGDRSTEVPTTLSPDGRNRKPHLKSFRDGWRSLRFFLIMAPRWLFGIPGLMLFTLGLFSTIRLGLGPLQVGSVTIDYHTMVYSSAAFLIGYQMLFMGVFAKMIALETGLHPPATKLGFLRRRSTLGFFVGAGLVTFTVGVVTSLAAFFQWRQVGFGDLELVSTLRLTIGSITCLLFGAQTLGAGFIFGLFNLVAEHREERESSLGQGSLSGLAPND